MNIFLKIMRIILGVIIIITGFIIIDLDNLWYSLLGFMIIFFGIEVLTNFKSIKKTKGKIDNSLNN